MAEENKEQGENQAAKGNGGGALNKLLLPLIAVVNLSILGAGAYLTYKGTLGTTMPVLKEPAALEELEAERELSSGFQDPVLYTMPSFTVNLEGMPRRLIRVEMSFAMLDKVGFEEIARNGPFVRDTIVRILNRKTFDDVESIQGKLFLKDEISVAINEVLREGVVKDIYFNEFLVQ